MELYHVFNRGVDKRNIVIDDKDRVRFLHDLFVFNDKNTSLNFIQPKRKDWTSDVQSLCRGKKQIQQSRLPLVRIHAFCLMHNHYHLLLSEAYESGLPLFMKKLNMGYTKYFNERHGRSGALWQGKYKKKLIEKDAHFLYIPYYIHLNPLDYVLPQWRERKVKDTQKALEILRQYRWSSHLDYLGERNFPSITERELLGGLIGTRARYQKEITSLMNDPQLLEIGQKLE